MTSANAQVSMESIADFLGAVRSNGVRLWSENGQLRYRAPKGALSEEQIARLRASRGHIVALLEGASDAQGGASRSDAKAKSYRAPLAYSQLAHWYSHGLSKHTTVRQIASATRLCGRLNIDALRESLATVVRRHDALRTRIVVCDGVPWQEIDAADEYALNVHDLTAIARSSLEPEVHRLIEQLTLEPIELAAGPLFGARLLRLADDEHVLIVAMAHIISDAFSRGILMRDLFSAYAYARSCRGYFLPAIRAQFADFAVAQRNAEKPWIERHGAYWHGRLEGCGRVRFPDLDVLQRELQAGWGVVPLKIGRELKSELRQWCRLRHTTLVMSVATAYVGLVLRWCSVAEMVIRYVTDGRVSPEVQNTIGYFASILHLRVELREDDDFIKLMKRLTEEYCKAHEHADFSYVAAQVPPPEFTRNTTFNWVPEGSRSDLPSLGGSEPITCSAVPIQPMLKAIDSDGEPAVLLYDSDNEIVGGVYFPLRRFSVETMERFARNFIVFLKELLRRPQARVSEILLQ